MKKKLLSVVLAVAVVAMSLSGVLGVFTVSASGTYDVIPDMGHSEDMFTIFSGSAFAGTFGSTGKSGQAHLTNVPSEESVGTSGLATSGYRYFEFDFFVDSLANFTFRNTKMYLALRTGNSTTGICEFQNQVTEDGWNHITVAYSSIKTAVNSSTFVSTATLDGISKVRFYIDIDAGETGASDRYRIANICATKYAYDLIPAMVEASPRFDIQNGVLFSSTLGSASKTGQQHPNGYDGSSPAEKIFTNPELSSDYGFFEFDFYVDNYTNFTARNAKMYLSLRKYNDGTYIATFEFTDQITASGWNHIKVIADTSDSNLDNTGRVRFFTDIDASSTGENDRYRVANICATRDECRFIPSMAAADFRYVMFDGDTFHGTIGSSAKDTGNPDPYNPAAKSFSQTTLSDYANFEFDFYIDNYSNFTARNTDFEFRLRKSDDANRGRCSFGDQITKDGWNHIKISRYSLKLDSGSAPSDGDINQAVNFRLYITVNAGATGATDRYKMANVCATSRPDYKTHSLALSDSISVNFFMDLSELTESKRSESYMTFAISNASEKRSNYNSGFTSETGGYFGFSCPINSVQMAETITPTFHCIIGGEEQTIVGTPYSVKDYIDYVNGHTESFHENVVTLANAIGNYGYYAQQIFTNKTFTSLAASYSVTYTAESYSSKKSAISSHAIVEANGLTGIANGKASGNFRYTLNLDSTTSILLKFNTGNVSFTSVLKGGENYADRKNAYTASDCILYLLHLPISQLGDKIIVTGTADGNAFTIPISGLSYIYGVLGDDGEITEESKNLASALYDYYDAAIACINSIPLEGYLNTEYM